MKLPLIATYLTGVSLILVFNSSAQVRKTGYEDTLYILSVGVNVSSADPVQKLEFAEKDAVNFAAAMRKKRQSSSYPNVHTITLVGEQATISNIRAILQSMYGKTPDCGACPGIRTELKELAAKMFRNNKATRLRPEDGLLIFFSGHGYRRCKEKEGDKCKNENFGNELHLIVHDTKRKMDNTGDPTFEKSWTDVNLEIDLAEIQVGRIAIILDSCYSGASEATGDDWRLGPLNSSGFSQLIYEKGIFILASSQKDQQSRERGEIGGGIFTTALISALETSTESTNLVEWFEKAKKKLLERPGRSASSGGSDAFPSCIDTEKELADDERPMNPPENIRTVDILKPNDIEQLLMNHEGISRAYRDYRSHTSETAPTIRLAVFFATRVFNEKPINLCRQEGFRKIVVQKEGALRRCATTHCQNRVILDTLLAGQISERALVNQIQEPIFLYYQRPRISPEDWIF